MCSVLRGVSRQVLRTHLAQLAAGPAALDHSARMPHCAFDPRMEMAANIRSRFCQSGAQPSSASAVQASSNAFYARQASSAASGSAAATPLKSETIREVLSSDDVSKLLAPRDTAAQLLVDTLQLMKQFEENGLNRPQAEALTRHLTEIILSQVLAPFQLGSCTTLTQPIPIQCCVLLEV
jgi:hypothetical protein